jgi:hypothetical protein
MILTQNGRDFRETDAWVIMDMGQLFPRQNPYAYEVVIDMDLHNRRMKELREKNPTRTYEYLKTKAYI